MINRLIHKFIDLFRLKPAQLMLMSFAGLIGCGAVLLKLPAATVPGETTSFLDALFTATSATCVTGLTVHDTAAHFTLFGQAVILALIQVGGLGIMTFSVSFARLLRRAVSVKNQSILQDVLDQESLQSVRRLVGFILAMTFGLEAAGAVGLYRSFRPAFAGAGETLWHAVFHSVSAFCNAGFSTFPDSLTRYAFSLPVNFVIGLLIVLGGIGFPVISDLFQAMRARWTRAPGPRFRFRVQSRIALSLSGGLILAGALLIFLLERHHLWSGMSTDHALLLSLFQSVSSRTAGFNTCEIGALHSATLFLLLVWMFIGASPGGTGGGIKTTTVAVLWAVMRAGFGRREDADLYRRSLPVDGVQKAVMVLCSSLLLVCAAVALMTVFEAGKPFLSVLFETVSAFGTVGLSTGITASLSPAGRFLLTLVMFAGRLGPLTVGFALMLKPRAAKYRYAEERIMIG